MSSCYNLRVACDVGLRTWPAVSHRATRPLLKWSLLKLPSVSFPAPFAPPIYMMFSCSLFSLSLSGYKNFPFGRNVVASIWQNSVGKRHISRAKGPCLEFLLSRFQELGGLSCPDGASVRSSVKWAACHHWTQ